VSAWLQVYKPVWVAREGVEEVVVLDAHLKSECTLSILHTVPVAFSVHSKLERKSVLSFSDKTKSCTYVMYASGGVGVEVCLQVGDPQLEDILAEFYCLT